MAPASASGCSGVAGSSGASGSSGAAVSSGAAGSSGGPFVGPGTSGCSGAAAARGSRPALPIGPIPFCFPGAATSVSLSPTAGCGTEGSTPQNSGDLCGGAGAESGPRPSVAEDLLRMFEESALADVEVVCTVGFGRHFQAHRLVLAARSPVFKAMFLTGMREKRMGKVIIEDASPEAVQCLLDFAYKDACPSLDEACVFDALRLASKYDVPGLRDLCLDFMARHARSDNVVGFLDVCSAYALADFKCLLLSALVDNPAALHECVHGQGLERHPELMLQLLSLCAHRLSKGSQEPRVVKHFDGLPYRSRCFLCVREVASMSKQTLGEMLFPMVQKFRPEHANKITGMIIELDNLELVPLFESESALREKVEEAMAVLRAAEEPVPLPLHGPEHA